MTFHITLNDELRTKYKSLQKGKKKGLFDVVNGKLVRRYKLICKASRELRISGGRTRPLKGSLTKRNRKLVRSFYQRDDISRLTAGIKETITRSGIKKQKRLLCDTIEKTHEKFLLENTEIKISYQSFCRLRPFWVVQPKESDRDTCACKTHENMQFLVNALHSSNLLSSTRLSDVVGKFACDISSMDCMYGKCEKCKNVKNCSGSQD